MLVKLSLHFSDAGVRSSNGPFVRAGAVNSICGGAVLYLLLLDAYLRFSSSDATVDIPQ